jgi:hypothetical protein
MDREHFIAILEQFDCGDFDGQRLVSVAATIRFLETRGLESKQVLAVTPGLPRRSNPGHDRRRHHERTR